MRALGDVGLLGRTFDGDALADALESRRKKRRYAYLAWLCLGSHYLYLRRPVVQALFWLSLGGLLIWWVADLMRLPALVERHNRRASAALLSAWQQQFEQQPRGFWPTQPEARQPEPAPVPVEASLLPVAGPAISMPRRASGRRLAPGGAGMILIGLLATVVAVSVLAPRPVYPRGAHEPSYRTLRQVNVRAQPGTRGPVHATAPRNVLLRGIVEEHPAASPSTWLRITRGPHAGRYVALQNLDRR